MPSVLARGGSAALISTRTADHRARRARGPPRRRPRRAVPRLRGRRSTRRGGWTRSRRGSRTALAGLGVGHGDRVATLLENRAEQVVSFFAALKLGAVQVPINTAYKGEFLRHQLADSGARVFIVQGDFASRAVEVVGDATTPSSGTSSSSIRPTRSSTPSGRAVGRRVGYRERPRRSTPTNVRPATSRASSTPRARPVRRRAACSRTTTS